MGLVKLVGANWQGSASCSLFPVLRGEGRGEGRGARGVVALFDSQFADRSANRTRIGVERRSPLSPTLSHGVPGRGSKGSPNTKEFAGAGRQRHFPRDRAR